MFQLTCSESYIAQDTLKQDVLSKFKLYIRAESQYE